MMVNEPGAYVYGDPRFKVVDLRIYNGKTRIHATCVFRVGVVAVHGEPRSRLIMTVLAAGVESGATGEVDLGDYVGVSKVIDFEVDDIDAFVPGVAPVYDAASGTLMFGCMSGILVDGVYTVGILDNSGLRVIIR